MLRCTYSGTNISARGKLVKASGLGQSVQSEINSVHNLYVRFCEAFARGGTAETLQELMRKCSDRHTQLVREAAMGMGCVRSFWLLAEFETCFFLQLRSSPLRAEAPRGACWRPITGSVHGRGLQTHERDHPLDIHTFDGHDRARRVRARLAKLLRRWV